MFGSIFQIILLSVTVIKSVSNALYKDRSSTVCGTHPWASFFLNVQWAGHHVLSRESEGRFCNSGLQKALKHSLWVNTYPGVTEQQHGLLVYCSPEP